MKSWTSTSSSLLILVGNVAAFSPSMELSTTGRIYNHLPGSARRCTQLGAALGESNSVESLALGFDFGTSGARVIAVDGSGQQVEEASIRWSSEHDAANPDAWRAAVDDLLFALPASLRARVGRACVGGPAPHAC